jgi:hypothetical protein
MWRLAQSLREVYGATPLTFYIAWSRIGFGGIAFVSGNSETITKALENDAPLKNFISTNTFSEKHLLSNPIKPTNDDWPYLYIEKPTIPTLFILLGFILVALWYQSSYHLRSKGVKITNFFKGDAKIFAAMGGGFCLFQVYGVNQCSILFGMSWHVNAIVITAILLMALFANYMLPLIGSYIKPHIAFLLLVLVLIGFYFVNFSQFISLPFASKMVIAIIFFGAPMFISGVCFAKIFEKASDPSLALGANMFGALIGGALQLLTFLLGIKSLLLIAVAFYLVALFSSSPFSLFPFSVTAKTTSKEN